MEPDSLASSHNTKGKNMKEFNPIEALAEVQAIVSGSHLVYKAGTHGPGYINKEAFADLGAIRFVQLLEAVAENAIEQGLDVSNAEKVGVLGPAMGAIPYALTVAAYLEDRFSGVTFYPARTELEINGSGNKVQVIPQKLETLYQDDPMIIIEDIVNNGTTIREVRDLIGVQKVISALCVADRGGQTTQSLGMPQYHPLIQMDMQQHAAHECPLCKEGIPINTELGKGSRWVELFGSPPYSSEADFSAFWE